MQNESGLFTQKLILDLWKWPCQDLYKEMIASNVKPSVATFSILIRLYAQCVLGEGTRRRMARERRGAEFSSAVSMATLYYKTIH